MLKAIWNWMKERAFSLWEKICSELSLQVLLICLLIVLAALFLIVVFDGCPRWTNQYLGISKKDEALKFLGIGMGGVLLALQALMSYKRAKALEDTVRLTEGGQWQERLKNAVEHLGSDSDLLQMADSYELYHLAQYTEESHLRQIVLDILGDYIRRKTSEEG